MGPLGLPEMMFIFVLALVLFGPKKLPEIGRTVGKAISEFKRASNELKTTFEREMTSLDQETNSIKEIATQYQYDNYNYDYNYNPSEAPLQGAAGQTYDSTYQDSSTASASATQGAESPAAVAPEGTVARGEENASVSEPNGSQPSAPTAETDYHDSLQPNSNASGTASQDRSAPADSKTSEHNA